MEDASVLKETEPPETKAYLALISHGSIVGEVQRKQVNRL